MFFSRIFLAVADNIDSLSSNIRPTMATLLAAASAAGNVAVWMEAVKGWASLIVVIISVPTAIVILVYWLFKVRREWIDAQK